MDLNSDDAWRHANIHERHGGALRKIEAIDTSLRSTITLSKECHEAVHKHLLNMEVMNEAQGFNGPVVFTGTLANGRKLLEPYRSMPTVEHVIRQTESGDDDHDDDEPGVGNV